MNYKVKIDNIELAGFETIITMTGSILGISAEVDGRDVSIEYNKIDDSTYRVATVDQELFSSFGNNLVFFGIPGFVYDKKESDQAHIEKLIALSKRIRNLKTTQEDKDYTDTYRAFNSDKTDSVVGADTNTNNNYYTIPDHVDTEFNVILGRVVEAIQGSTIRAIGSVGHSVDKYIVVGPEIDKALYVYETDSQGRVISGKVHNSVINFNGKSIVLDVSIPNLGFKAMPCSRDYAELGDFQIPAATLESLTYYSASGGTVDYSNVTNVGLQYQLTKPISVFQEFSIRLEKLDPPTTGQVRVELETPDGTSTIKFLDILEIDNQLPKINFTASGSGKLLIRVVLNRGTENLENLYPILIGLSGAQQMSTIAEVWDKTGSTNIKTFKTKENMVFTSDEDDGTSRQPASFVIGWGYVSS